MGNADYLVQCYGIRRFLADVDRDRQYWRDGTGHLGALLDWLGGEGWPEFALQAGLEHYANAHQFRQRYLIAAASGRGS